MKKHQHKCKYFCIQDPVFKTAVSVFAGSKEDIFEQVCRVVKISNKEQTKKIIVENDYVAEVSFFKENNSNAKMTLMFLNTTKCIVSTISHEIFHLVCGELNNLGLIYSSDSEEAYAYLIGWYTKEIYKKLGIKDGRI